MEFQEGFEMLFEDGAGSLWRTAQAIPEEKLDWMPGGEARTARQLLEELVTTTTFTAQMIRDMKMPEMTEEKLPKSITELEKLHKAAITDFLKAVSEFPEDKLQEKLDLPWGNLTFFQIISYPYWNMMYHFGQISYIQLLYGDKEMY